MRLPPSGGCGLVPLGNGREWNQAGTVNTPKKESRDGQTVLLSKCGRTIFSRDLLVVNRCRGSDPVVMEIILAWLWLIGIVSFLVLVGYLLQGRRNNQSSHGLYCLGDRLLPDRIELFRQRRRRRHIIFSRCADRSEPRL